MIGLGKTRAVELEEYYWLLLSNDSGLPVLSVRQSLASAPALATQGLVSGLLTAASHSGIAVSQLSGGADDEHRLSYASVPGGACAVFTNIVQVPGRLGSSRVSRLEVPRGPQISAAAEGVALCNHLFACGLGSSDWATLMRNPNIRALRSKLPPLGKALDLILRTSQRSLQHAPVTAHARCLPADPLPLNALLSQVAAEVGATHAALAIGRVVVAGTPAWWLLPPRTATVIVAAAQAAGGAAGVEADTRRGASGSKDAFAQQQSVLTGSVAASSRRLRRSSTLSLVGGAGGSSRGLATKTSSHAAGSTATPGRPFHTGLRASSGVLATKASGLEAGGALPAHVTSSSPAAGRAKPRIDVSIANELGGVAGLSTDGSSSSSTGALQPQNTAMPAMSAVSLNITAPPQVPSLEGAAGSRVNENGTGVALLLQSGVVDAEQPPDPSRIVDGGGSGGRTRRKRLSRVPGSSPQIVTHHFSNAHLDALNLARLRDAHDTMPPQLISPVVDTEAMTEATLDGVGTTTFTVRPCTAIAWAAHLPLSMPLSRDASASSSQCFWHSATATTTYVGAYSKDRSSTPLRRSTSTSAAAEPTGAFFLSDPPLCVPATAVSVPLSLLPTLEGAEAGGVDIAPEDRGGASVLGLTGLGLAVATTRSHVQLILLKPSAPGEAPGLSLSAEKCAAAVGVAIAGWAGLAAFSSTDSAIDVGRGAAVESQFPGAASHRSRHLHQDAGRSSVRLMRLLSAIAQAECAAVRCHTAQDWGMLTDSQLAFLYTEAPTESASMGTAFPLAPLQLPVDGWAHALLDAAQDGMLGVGLVASLKNCFEHEQHSRLQDVFSEFGNFPRLFRAPSAGTEMSVYSVRSGADPFLLRLRMSPFRTSRSVIPSTEVVGTARTDASSTVPALGTAERPHSPASSNGFAAHGSVPAQVPRPAAAASTATSAVAQLLAPLDLGKLFCDKAAACLPSSTVANNSAETLAPLLRWSVPAAVLVSAPTCQCTKDASPPRLAALLQPASTVPSPVVSVPRLLLKDPASAHCGNLAISDSGLSSAPPRAAVLGALVSSCQWPSQRLGDASLSPHTLPQVYWIVASNGSVSHANALHTTSAAASAIEPGLPSETVVDLDSNELSPTRRRVQSASRPGACAPPPSSQPTVPLSDPATERHSVQGSIELGRSAVHAMLSELLSVGVGTDRQSGFPLPAARQGPNLYAEENSCQWSTLYLDSALAALVIPTASSKVLTPETLSSSTSDGVGRSSKRRVSAAGGTAAATVACWHLAWRLHAVLQQIQGHMQNATGLESAQRSHNRQLPRWLRLSSVCVRASAVADHQFRHLCAAVDVHLDLHALAAHVLAAERPTRICADAPVASGMSSGTSDSASMQSPGAASDAALRLSRLLPEVLPAWILGAGSAAGLVSGRVQAGLSFSRESVGPGQTAHPYNANPTQCQAALDAGNGPDALTFVNSIPSAIAAVAQAALSELITAL